VLIKLARFKTYNLIFIYKNEVAYLGPVTLIGSVYNYKLKPATVVVLWLLD
jgi:hypothetical protein